MCAIEPLPFRPLRIASGSVCTDFQIVIPLGNYREEAPEPQIDSKSSLP